MEKTLKGLTLLLMMVIVWPNMCLAQCAWGADTRITRLDQQNEQSNSVVHGLWVFVEGTVTNASADPCTSTPTAYFLQSDYGNPAQNSEYKTDLALLMAAFLGNKQVKFCVRGCYNYNSPIIGAVRVFY